MISRQLLLFLSIFSLPTFAIEPSERMKFGRYQLEPRLSINVQEDDNLLESPTDELNVILTEYVPSFKVNYSGVLLDANVAYTIHSGSFNDSPLDDYDDHTLNTSFSYQLTRRSRFELDFDYIQDHISRSFNDLDFNNAVEPDEYEETTIGGNYIFGRKEAKGRLELFTQYTDREFTNNRINTFEDDREITLFGSRFQLRLNPRSSAFIEVSREEFNYINDPVSENNIFDTLDSKRDQFYAGFRWSLTAKSEGQLKLGYVNKSFSDTDRDDFSTFSWQANVTFALSPQSNLRIITAKGDKESDQGISGGFIDQESFSMSYQKNWGEKLSTTVFAKLINSKYIDYTDDREEQLTTYGLRLDYSLQRWIDIGFSADIENNDAESNTNNYDYNRNRFTFHLTVGL